MGSTSERPRRLIVDSDTHINEPVEVFARFLPAPFRSRAPFTIKDTFGFTRIVFEGRLFPDPRLKQAHAKNIEGTRMGGIHEGAADPMARLADLDLDGVDVQVIYGSLGLAISSLPDPEFAVAMSIACNDYYADFCSASPDRLKAMATLPLQDVPASVREIRRAIMDRGFIGITLPPNVNGKNLDHPDFHPIFEEVCRLNAPVAIHWGNGAYMNAAGVERFDTHFMTHAIGHPFEQMIATASFFCGGLLELFPTLRVGFLEAGCGWLPYWFERLHEHWERRGAEMPLMKRDPFEYLESGNCFFATEPDEKMLPAVIAQLGDDCLLYSSDYPHTDSKFPNSVRCIRARDDLSEESKIKLLSTNGSRFYGLAAGAG